jgi:hypothetical protein
MNNETVKSITRASCRTVVSVVLSRFTCYVGTSTVGEQYRNSNHHVLVDDELDGGTSHGKTVWWPVWTDGIHDEEGTPKEGRKFDLVNLPYLLVVTSGVNIHKITPPVVNEHGDIEM